MAAPKRNVLGEARQGLKDRDSPSLGRQLSLARAILAQLRIEVQFDDLSGFSCGRGKLPLSDRVLGSLDQQRAATRRLDSLHLYVRCHECNNLHRADDVHPSRNLRVSGIRLTDDPAAFAGRFLGLGRCSKPKAAREEQQEN